MTLSKLVNQAQKFTVHNSPAILTAIGAVGVVTTAYMASKASFKAAEVLRLEESTAAEDGTLLNKQVRELTTREKAQLVWKLYIPAVATGAMTVAAVIGANRIGTRQTAAMVAAFSVSEKALAEYKDKVVETLGKNKEEKIRDEIAQERVTQNPPKSSEVIITGAGEVMCYEVYTGRYFKANMEDLKKAQNDFNYVLLNDFSASLSEFYYKIGLPTTALSDNVGWNSDKQMELVFSTVMSEGQEPCIAFDYHPHPYPEFYKAR